MKQKIVEARVTSEIPRIGTKWLAIQICNPPIHEMDVAVSCCGEDRDARGGAYNQWPRLPAADPLPPLKSSTGITLGDILDVSVKHQAEHRLCPHADQAWQLDADGYADVTVIFKGRMELKDDDPIFLEDVKCWHEEEAWQDVLRGTQTPPNENHEIELQYTHAKKFGTLMLNTADDTLLT